MVIGYIVAGVVGFMTLQHAVGGNADKIKDLFEEISQIEEIAKNDRATQRERAEITTRQFHEIDTKQQVNTRSLEEIEKDIDDVNQSMKEINQSLQRLSRER